MSTSTWTWLVQFDYSQLRADAGLLKAIQSGVGEWEGESVSVSRNQIQKLIDESQVLINDKPIQSKTRLQPNQRIIIRFPEPKPTGLIPENIPLDILFQDSHLVVVNKPPGLTVHPSDTQTEGTLVHALLHHIRDLSGIGGELRPGIVHRIDKNTSGALVITKSDEAHRILADTFARHDIERIYWAFCYGSPKENQGTIRSLIGRSPQDRKKMSMTVKDGRSAVTHYRVLENYGKSSARPFGSWIEARLETGRTHQVRVHLTGLGHSLMGDPSYGEPSEKHPKWLALPPTVRAAIESLPGQALHARVLGFRHPITHEALRFEAPLPAELQVLTEELKKFSE